MLESFRDFWYIWLIFVVLVVVLVIVASKASKAISKKNAILEKQHEQLKRYSELIEKYSSVDKALAENADAKELTEGVMCALQHQVEKSGDPDAEYESAEKWRREVYALFYFDEDITAESLSFFFRNNGGPLPREAINALESIGYAKVHNLALQMFAMCDDKNESVSFDKERIAELDEKFKECYNSDELFALTKNYIIANA